MKIIRLNKNINEAILDEAPLKAGDIESEKKLSSRIIDLIRVANSARAAAKKAAEAGNADLAAKLTDRADELTTLANSATIDKIDQDEPNSSSQSSNNENDADKANNKQGEDVEKSDNKDGQDSQANQDDDTPYDGEKADDKGAKLPQRDSVKGEHQSNSDQTDNNNAGGADSEDSDQKSDKSDKSNSDDDGDEGDDGQDSSSDDTEDDADGQGKDNKDSKDSQDKGDKSDGDGSDSDDSDEDENDDNKNSGKSSKSSNNKQGKQSQGGSGDGDDGDDESDSDGDGDSDSQPTKDPFADDEDIPQLQLPGGKPQQPKEADLDDIIKQLSKLNPEAKRGAIDALNDLLGNKKKAKNESLSEELITEGSKTLRELEDDEFADLINDTLDLIDKAEPVIYAQNKKQRIGRIKQMASDTDLKTELDMEISDEATKDHQKIKAREREAQKHGEFGGIKEFSINFYNAIKSQIDLVYQTYATYDEINPEYESEDIIMKTDVEKQELDEALPVVDIYFDRSGSWSAQDTAIGKRAIESIAEFERNGEVKINLYYFADNVSQSENDRNLGGGTSAWNKIIRNIQATGANNVVIMTDGDMNSIYNKLSHTVRGCVWYIWKNGICAPDLVKHLRGREGTYQFQFKNSDFYN